MNTELIERHFAQMGSRFKMTRPASRRGRPNTYTIDIHKDNRGEFFDLTVPEKMDGQIDLTVMQTVPEDRHLLLLVRKNGEEQKDRFLCGHDERAWFVAAVPGKASSVRDAKEALKPRRVRLEQALRAVPASQVNRRKNRAFRRQGEWFFIEEPRLQVDAKLILRNEPIRRGGGKPHTIAEVYRRGGEVVYVHARYRNGVRPAEYAKILANTVNMSPSDWRMMVRNPEVFARGTVRHADHKTITLHGWHRVLMNTENESATMRAVAFLD
jgi:hypothetical protein